MRVRPHFFYLLDYISLPGVPKCGDWGKINHGSKLLFLPLQIIYVSCRVSFVKITGTKYESLLKSDDRIKLHIVMLSC